MDAVKFLEEAKRICSSHEHCNDCPFESYDCSFGAVENPQMEVEIVEKWASEHPVKTRQSEFLKIFPSPAYCDSYIDICPQQVQRNYTPEEGCEKTTCHECEKAYWLAEVE